MINFYRKLWQEERKIIISEIKGITIYENSSTEGIAQHIGIEYNVEMETKKLRMMEDAIVWLGLL